MFYYNVKVKVTVDLDDEKPKFRTDQFLVHGVSVTDVEAKIHKDFEGYPNDWEVLSVVQTKVVKVIE